MKSPSDLGMAVDDWRPGQRLAIRTALHSKRPHVVIQASTGSGKSLIGAALTQLSPYRSVVLTATLGLMEQYTREFPFLYDVRGMSNYECLAARDEFQRLFPLKVRGRAVRCDDGPCRVGLTCTLKDLGCLYFDRYRSALASAHVLTNYSYWLSMRRFGRGLGLAQQLICDEAHALPEQLMAACRIEIPANMLDSKLPRKWQDWKRWALAKSEDLVPGDDDDTRYRRSRMQDTLKMLSGIDETWAWDREYDKVVFEPTIPRLLLPMLHTFDSASTIVYLSATITPAMLRLLGVPDSDVDYLALKSSFPVERRPVYLVPSARVDYRMSENAKARWYATMDAIIAKRLDRKGIIHTVSYTRQQEIMANSAYGKYMIAPQRSSEVPRAVAEFKAAKAPAILISPSVMTGYDFPYCLAPHTRVLTSDLKYVEVGSVRAGDRLAAFDEHQMTGRGRRWRETEVTRTREISRPCYKLTFEDGTEITASAEHKWLVIRSSGESAWITTKNLRCSKTYKSRVARLLDVWEKRADRQAGYLAGIFDGEGHFYQGIGAVSRGNARQVVLAMHQVDNVVLRQTIDALKLEGFKYKIYSKGARIEGCQPGFTVALVRRNEQLRLLGEIRPVRLLNKLRWDALGQIRATPCRLVQKEFLGNRCVTAMQTTSKTFIAEGLASHNCECEYQIVAKVPFPNTQSAITKARVKATEGYRDHLTVQHLVQACGRGMRAADDACETFIVDEHVRWFLEQAEDLIPSWFAESIVSTRRTIKPPPRLER
jgi:hypothetical protein